MTLKIWSKQLLYIKPDPTPYLLAARTPQTVRLMASGTSPLLYTISQQVLQNSLNNTTLYDAPYLLSFRIHSSIIYEGTSYVLSLPGFVDIKTEYGTVAFKFAWRPEWFYINSSSLLEGWNEISIENDGVRIFINANSDTYTLYDTATMKQEVLAYTNYGCTVSDTAVTGVSEGYILLKNQEALNFGAADTWEVGMKFTYTKGAEGHNGLFGSTLNYYAPELDIDTSNNQIYGHFSSDGISRNIGDSRYAGYTLTEGSTYWIKLYFDGSKYAIKISSNGISYSEYTLVSTTTKLVNKDNPGMCFLNRRMENGQNYWLKGPMSCLYEDTYVKLNDTYYCKGFIPVELPTMHTGYLQIYKPWAHLRNVSATFI